MPYRVMDNEDMNIKSGGGNEGYAEMLETAMNNMEADGFQLVALQQAESESNPYYIFHREP